MNRPQVELQLQQQTVCLRSNLVAKKNNNKLYCKPLINGLKQNMSFFVCLFKLFYFLISQGEQIKKYKFC